LNVFIYERYHSAESQTDAGHGTIVLDLAINVNKLSSRVPLNIMKCTIRLHSQNLEVITER